MITESNGAERPGSMIRIDTKIQNLNRSKEKNNAVCYVLEVKQRDIRFRLM